MTAFSREQRTNYVSLDCTEIRGLSVDAQELGDETNLACRPAGQPGMLCRDTDAAAASWRRREAAAGSRPSDHGRAATQQSCGAANGDSSLPAGRCRSAKCTLSSTRFGHFTILYITD